MPDLQPMHYFSTLRGVTEQETHSPVVYYGASWRIPRASMRSEEAAKKAMKQDFDRLEALLQRTFEDKKVIVGGIIERYETYDIETGDMLVLYRIPYIEK
jgi:hypothetical protein